MNKEFTDPEQIALAEVFGLSGAPGQHGPMLHCRFLPVWTVWETDDDGRRRHKFVGVFDTPSKANLAAKSKGSWGAPGDVDEALGLFIGPNEDRCFLMTSPLDYELNVDIPGFEKKARAEALAKLTPLERQLLGLEKI